MKIKFVIGLVSETTECGMRDDTTCLAYIYFLCGYYSKGFFRYWETLIRMNV